MRILLLGRKGQLGTELQDTLARLGETMALDRAGSAGLCGDLSDLPGIERTVLAWRPDVVVNAAAYTAVDRAESETALAHRINAEAPATLAAACRRVDALLLHYSSDYVFDGRGEVGWTEDDEPRPVNVYGASKLAGERAIAASGCRHLIFRTSWVYGAGENFIRKILRLGAERDRLQVVADQVGAPTAAARLAQVSALALRCSGTDAALSGVYHVTAAGETTWHAYASRILEWALEAGWPVKARVVEPVSSDQFMSAARRPLNSRLDTTRIREALGPVLTHWTEDARRAVLEICSRPAD